MSVKSILRNVITLYTIQYYESIMMRSNIACVIQKNQQKEEFIEKMKASSQFSNLHERYINAALITEKHRLY